MAKCNRISDFLQFEIKMPLFREEQGHSVIRLRRLSLSPLVVLLHVSLILGGELTQSVNDLAVVVLTAADILFGTDDGDVDLAGTCANVVPVDEVDVSELTKVKLAVLDGEGLASAEEAAAKVTVGIHAGVVTKLVNVSAVLNMYRTGMTVLMLLSKIGDHLSHDVEKVVLEVLKVERIDVV